MHNRAVEGPNQRSEADRKVDAMFARVFGTGEGKLVLGYLKAELVNTIMGPEATDQALRYREGQRSVIGICEWRAALGRHHLAARRSDPAVERPASGSAGRSPRRSARKPKA